LKRELKISLYWKCQIIGWSVAALYWGYAGYLSGGFNLTLGAVRFVLDVFLYIMVTHVYRNFALRHQWQNMNLRDLLIRIIPAAIALGLAYTLVTSLDVYFTWVLFKPGYAESFAVFFRSNGLGIFIAGMRLMSIWLLAYHLYHYAQREINITKENARLSLIAKEAQLNNLTAQLNPHFLFNSLNNIKALVVENPGLARRAIDLLSDLLRTSLYNRDNMFISIKDELAMVKDYLELAKMRFEERLQVNIEVEPRLLSEMILPLSIQTLVENSIKHGIDKRKKGGLISIKIEQTGGHIKIAVCNPGKLDNEKQTEGFGLKNLNERLKLQFNSEAGFKLEKQGEMILATILIPLA